METLSYELSQKKTLANNQGYISLGVERPRHCLGVQSKFLGRGPEARVVKHSVSPHVQSKFLWGQRA